MLMLHIPNLLQNLALRRVAGSLGWVGASQVLTAVARFLILAIVARTLPPEMFGSFAFFVALTLVVANLTELGLGRTLVRFVGVARGKQDLTLAQQYSAAVLKCKVLLSIPILGIGLIAVWTLRSTHTVSLVGLALAAGLFASFGPLLAFMFLVEGKFQHYFWAFSIDPIRLVIVIALLLGGGIATQNLLYAYLISPVVLVFLWPSLGMNLKDLLQRTTPLMYKRLWDFGKWLFLITALEALWLRLDVLMLEGLGGPHDVGIYTGAYVFMGVAALISGSVATMVYPQMAEAQGRKETLELEKQYVASTNLVAYLGLPCVVGVAALAPELVHTIIGSSYSSSIRLFPWLAVYGVFLILQMNTGAVFFAVGRPVLNFYWILFLVVSGVAGNLWLIPRWHAEGAAVALAVTTALGALLSWSGVAMCLRVWPDFRRIGLFSLSAGLMYLAVRFFPLPFLGVSELLIRVMIGIVVYFGAIKMTCGGVSAPLADMAETC
jgi:O-antigen/teichoic acid export membrane protein